MNGNLKDMLYELGYSNIMENAKEYRTRPIYRESDNNTVLRINKENGYFVDFARNISGSFEDLVKLSLNLKSVEDVKSWVDKHGWTSSQSEEIKPTIKAPKIFPKAVLAKLSPEHNYWIERGISEYTVAQFRGGIVREGKMANRYVFPIFDAKENLVGVAGRDLINSDRRPKWKLIGDKSQWKYPAFLNHRHLKKQKTVIVVESIGDMLALWDCGVKNICVVFGLDVGPALLSLFLRYDMERVILSFNNDSENNSAGNAAADKAHRKLLRYFDHNQVEIALPSRNDFGEMSKGEIIKWVKSHNIYLPQESRR
tara:strand:- start:1334 stop:2269 length:936 start_codon:yes stop_codon:yes gene_type:complete